MNLKEYNQVKYQQYKQAESQNKFPKIECECGALLEFYEPHSVCMSHPPQMRVRCNICGFKGYAVV